MNVHISEAGHDDLAAKILYSSVRWYLDAVCPPDRLDLVTADDKNAVLDRSSSVPIDNNSVSKGQGSLELARRLRCNGNAESQN
jgi:hypothetical protein